MIGGVLCALGRHRYPREGLTAHIGPCLRGCGYVKRGAIIGSLAVHYFPEMEQWAEEGPPTPGGPPA